jgi:hypothetical protein
MIKSRPANYSNAQITLIKMQSSTVTSAATQPCVWAVIRVGYNKQGESCNRQLSDKLMTLYEGRHHYARTVNVWKTTCTFTVTTQSSISDVSRCCRKTMSRTIYSKDGEPTARVGRLAADIPLCKIRWYCSNEDSWHFLISNVLCKVC